MRYLKKATAIMSLALVLSLLCSSLVWAKPPKAVAGKGNNKNVTLTEEESEDKSAQKVLKEERKAQERLEKEERTAAKIEEKVQKRTEKQSRLIELSTSYLEANTDEEATEVLEQLCALEPTQERFKALKTLHKRLQKGRPVTPELFVNGEQYQEKVHPVVRYGRTLVPLRALAARLKAEVAYDNETKTITMVRDGYTAVMGLDSNLVTIYAADGSVAKEVELDVTPLLENNSTFVPLRALAEIFGAKVTYDDDTNIIVIEDPDDDDLEDDEELPEDDEDLDEDDLDDTDEEDDVDDLEDTDDELDDDDEETEDTEDDDDELEDEEDLQ